VGKDRRVQEGRSYEFVREACGGALRDKPSRVSHTKERFQMKKLKYLLVLLVIVVAGCRGLPLPPHPPGLPHPPLPFAPR